MSGIKKSKVLKSSLSIFLAITIIFSSAYVGLSEIDFSGIKFTNPFAVKSNAVSVDDLDLIYGTDEGITRAEWLHNLVVVFDMTIEDESLPDNYFSDLTEEHEYYSDILLAVEFGVVDIAAGGELRPDDYVTRDFAASTLNFCLGYQLGEDTAYTFTDSDACSDPISAQIALNREWFELTDGCFAPDTIVISSEAEKMLNDAFEVLERQNIDENYENEYEFAENVIVVPDGTQVEKGDDGKIYITDCPESLLVGDNFAVYFNGIPCFYTATAIAFEDNVTVIDVEQLEADEGLTDIDAQGVINAEDMEIIPYEGVEVSVEKDTDFSTFSIKKVDTISTGFEVDFGGITGKVSVKVKNPYIDYYALSGRVYVALCGETEVVYNVSASTAAAAGMSNGFPLYKCVIPGIGSFDITINVDFSGTASGVVKGWLVAGVECVKNDGLRAVRDFTQKECYTNVEAQARVSLRASFNVSEMPVLKAYVYAEAGMKVNFSKKTFKEGVPETCTHFAAYLFAEYGASASAKFGLWKTSESITYEIFNEANSPVRIVNHYEDGQLVPGCTRGTTYATSGYYTKASSRWSGCGWISAGGGYALNADGTQFKLYNYTLDENNNATITKYNGNAWSVYIPEEIDGCTVKAIGNYAFVGKNVRSISIPDTVTKIGSYTFSDCTSLKDVTLSKSLVSLGNCAFNNTAIESIEIPKSLDSCSSSDSGSYTLDGVKYSYYEAGPFGLCENLKTVTFEKGTTQIAQYLFTGCVGLEKITIPDTVTVIEEGAFKHCFRLKEVTILDSVTKIDNDAFNGCTSLKDVTLSKSLQSMGVFCFANTAIESITIPKSLDICPYVDGNFAGYEYEGEYYTLLGGPFWGCEKLKNVAFEDGITQIAFGLFAGCVGLEEITIPDTVTTIESHAFQGCLRLTEAVIGDAVTNIDRYAFSDCISLKDVTLSKSLQSMGIFCFANTAIESITIPKSLDTCPNVTGNFADYEYEGECYTLRGGPFWGCEKLKNVTFEDGITKIAVGLFAGCVGLEEITIPDTVTTIESHAFQGCLRLTEAVIGNAVTSISDYVFQKCVSLLDVTIPNSVTVIEEGAFVDCLRLKEVTIPDSVTEIGEYAFKRCVSLPNIVIPDSVTSMGDYCFDGCSSLESVKLPNKRVNIMRAMFYNCTSLKTIDFPKTVETIQSYAFYGCTALEDFTFSEGSNLKEIGYKAFYGCSSLKVLNLPESVKTLGESAFYGCSSLKEANLPETLETIDYYAFKNCVALEKVNIPQSVHSLGSEAFMSCEALETVDFADYSIKEIKSNTFKDCPGLKKIVLPKGLTKIGSQAFMNNTGLTEVVIPESVTSIDSTAFSYPAKTTIYGKAGSYAETFANNGGFKFVDINVPAEGLILKDGVENITLDVGETYRAEFEFYPEDANDVVTLTSNNDNVVITLHDIYADYTGDTVITATASSGLTYEFNVHIRNVKNISIIKQPTKLSYLMGESLDLSGIELQVNYNDGSSKIVTDYTVSGFDSSAEGTSTVTVKWIGANGREYTTTFDVEIVDPTPKVTGIYIDTLPDKIQYQLREKLDLTGMVVKATLADGSEKEVADYTTSSINVLKKGAQVVTVTYNGFTTSFTVYVCTADHSYGDWVTDAEATCTQPGMQHKTCSVCGYILTDEKASLGHNYSTEWTIDEVASCTEDGSKSHHCTRCDDKADVTVVKATGHNNVVLEAQASHPHTTTYKCSWCDIVTTENSVAADCVECNFTITSLDSNSYQLSSYIGLGIDVAIPAEYNGRKITTIANSCFKNNKTITSVKIAGGVTSIGSLAFMSCTSLEKVFIPASVTSIGTRAFYGFTGKIYCASGSYAHEYAVANDIDYVLVSVVETEDTQIDYDKLLICTSVQNCNDITKIFGLSETAFVVPTASYIYGSIELYGTGTIVTVFDGDDYVGDFTLIVEGDTNGDSVCDVIDCFEVERASNGNAELTGAYAMAADSNTDDIVDINDYQSIVNKALA